LIVGDRNLKVSDAIILHELFDKEKSINFEIEDVKWEPDDMKMLIDTKRVTSQDNPFIFPWLKYISNDQ
jgi:hypothetical protein